MKFQYDFVLDTVTVRVNEALKGGSLPGSLKCENIRPIYKKVDPSIKRNIDQWIYYHFFKSLVIFKQAPKYFEPFFNETLSGFRKAHSTQYALLFGWGAGAGYYLLVCFFMFVFIRVFVFWSLMSCLFFEWVEHDSCCVCFFVYLFSLSPFPLTRSYWGIEIVVSVM